MLCYIPERHLLLALLIDYKTICIYSTTTFKLLAVKKTKNDINTMSYSPHLDRILTGGVACILQIRNPTTFKIEAESAQKHYHYYLQSVQYAPKCDLIVARTCNRVLLYTRNLAFFTAFQIPNSLWRRSSLNHETFAISKNLLLATCRTKDQNILVGHDTTTGITKEYQEIFIPAVSCIEMTEESPLNVFTCLAQVPSHSQLPQKESDSYELTQFSVSPETRELALERKLATLYRFMSLQSVGNSKYLLAKSHSQEEFLLSINKEKVEMIKVITRSMSPLGGFCTYVMMRNEFCLLEMNEKNLMSMNRLITWREKEKEEDCIGESSNF